MESQHTAGPWFAVDQRASTLRSLGWKGPAHDAILIICYPPKEISQEHCDCIVARIDFSNRPEELTEGNMADARLIAAAPELLAALQGLLEGVPLPETVNEYELVQAGCTPDEARKFAAAVAAIAKATEAA